MVPGVTLRNRIISSLQTSIHWASFDKLKKSKRIEALKGLNALAIWLEVWIDHTGLNPYDRTTSNSFPQNLPLSSVIVFVSFQ